LSKNCISRKAKVNLQGTVIQIYPNIPTSDEENRQKTYLNERPRDCSPPSKIRWKESLNTACPKLSDKTTRPPVLSIATFISASPTCYTKASGAALVKGIRPHALIVPNITKHTSSSNMPNKHINWQLLPLCVNITIGSTLKDLNKIRKTIVYNTKR
jgi:hypothetical protein